MKKIISTNPAKNYETIGEVEVSTEKEIKEKVRLARKAQEGWSELGVAGRIKILKKVFDVLVQKRKGISSIASREIGFPLDQQETGDMGDGFDYFKWYLENAEKYLAPEITLEEERFRHAVHFEPIGVAAVIVPWNFPFCNWVWGVIPNLLVGNTVVFKHSEECPLTGRLIEEIVNGSGLPPGVFNEIYGDGQVGDFLVHQEIDLISFTGSSKVGKYLYRVAAEKFIKVLLELGGSSPGIVFEDVDIDEIIEIIYSKRFYHCGQVCDALKRLIVHESRFDELVAKLKNVLESKKIGIPEDRKTDIGPLVAKRQLDLLVSQVEDAKSKGAQVITGGRLPVGLEGAYYEPTLLIKVNPTMRVWREEVFGPVLPIVSFETEKEAIALANDTNYGLGSSIFTKDKKRASRVASKIKAGMVSINGGNYVLPCNPFGGRKESGLGREHGKYGLRELCEIKIVTEEK